MKKMFLLGALATLGLLASCQKEGASSGEFQPNEELNVITIDTQSDKTELEPLLALSEEILGINLEDGYVEKGTPLVIRILREFFQSVGNFIGGNYQTPKHSFKYFGSRKSFSLAMDQIRELSYNFTESDVPYLKIQLGDATSLKIGSLEVMPVSDFYLDIQGSDRIKGKSSLNQKFDNGHARVLVSDGLFVKFGYDGNSYAFTIYADIQETAGTESGNWESFGFIFGRFKGYPTLMDWYQNSLPIETDEIIPASVRAYMFPLSNTFTLTYDYFNDAVFRDFYIGDTGVSGMVNSEGVYIDINQGRVDEPDPDSDWMMASLFSNDECAVRGLWHDYLWASVFGCTQSQCRALSAEFANVFDETDPECNIAHYNRWFDYEGPHCLRIDAPLAIVPRAAAGMVWKPALGLKLTLGDGSTRLISFAELCAMDGERKWELLQALHSVPDDALSGVFSVGDNKKVRFSKGNLRATFDGSSYVWSFAPEQYGYVGNASGNTTIGAQSSGASVDLFGWSTSSTFYGIDESPVSSSYLGVFVEWGDAYCSSNGVAPGTWRTLTGGSDGEWKYLIDKRENASSLCRYGVTVCDRTNCLVLAPDDFEGNIEFEYDSITWPEAEAAGLVCLPAAGSRNGLTVENTGALGDYWTSSPKGTDRAYDAYFNLEKVDAVDNAARAHGYSVRLVTDAY
ncbi:MAG: hypothetical protein MJY61_01245 [Bacteroidales bacterium]|nr:hypothetical protein [Bacteroidales bacterium]